MYYAIVTEQSRKAKTTKGLYEYLVRNLRKQPYLPEILIAGYQASDGIQVPETDRHRVMNLKLHDEHLSPYFKSDMSLFHLLMMDETADIQMYRVENGWMFLLEGVQEAPKPFGNQGFDMR